MGKSHSGGIIIIIILNVALQVVKSASWSLVLSVLQCLVHFHNTAFLELHSSRRHYSQLSVLSHNDPNHAGPSTSPAPMRIPSWTVIAPQKDPLMFIGFCGEDVEEWLEEYHRASLLNH